MVKNKSRRFGGFLAVFIILNCYTVISAGALQYNDYYPSYIPFVGAAYVEVNSSLGQGSIVISSTQKQNYLSIGSGSSNIYNCSSSTVSGVFRTAQGVDYNIRATAFNSFQYAVTNGYQTIYEPLNVTQILSTNIEFVDYSGQNKQNDNFYFGSVLEKATFIISLLGFLSLILLLFILLVRGNKN